MLVIFNYTNKNMSLLNDTVTLIEKHREDYKKEFPNCNEDQIGYLKPPYTFIELISKQLECSNDTAIHLNWLANKGSGRLTFKH